jgi:hypothetical protein
MTEKTVGQQVGDGLRAMADMLEHNEKLAEVAKRAFSMCNAFSDDPAVLAEFLKAGKRYGADATKNAQSDDWFVARLVWGPVELHVNAVRDQVCTRKQVGTEVKAVREYVTVKKEVPVYEWDCKPLLADAVSE